MLSYMVDDPLHTPARPCVGDLLVLCVSPLSHMLQIQGFLYQCCLASSLLL